MIYISYGLLGAVLSAAFLLAIVLVSGQRQIPILVRTVFSIICVFYAILIWAWIDGKWEHWIEHDKLFYADGGVAESFESEAER